MALTDAQLERYSRHLIVKEIGVKGQKALLSSKVLVIGAGGLGSPVLTYLAAAGVGTLGICDGDVVSLSNLQRQILYTTDEVEWGPRAMRVFSGGHIEAFLGCTEEDVIESVVIADGGPSR